MYMKFLSIKQDIVGKKASSAFFQPFELTLIKHSISTSDKCSYTIFINLISQMQGLNFIYLIIFY